MVWETVNDRAIHKHVFSHFDRLLTNVSKIDGETDRRTIARLYVDMQAELSTGQVYPRVGSGRVGSDVEVRIFCALYVTNITT